MNHRPPVRILGMSAKVIRALGVAVAVYLILGVIIAYVRSVNAGFEFGAFDAIPAIVAMVAVAIPSAYASKSQHLRDSVILVAATVLGVSLILAGTLNYAWLLTNGFSMRSLLKSGFPENAIYLACLVFLAANSVLSFRALRTNRPVTTENRSR